MSTSSVGLNATMLNSSLGTLADSQVCSVPSGTLETTHYIDWGVGVQAGQIVIETATSASYTGNWAPVATVDFVTTSPGVVAPKQDYVRVQGMYKAFRHRVTLPVQGGTVSSRTVASKTR